MPNIEIKAIYHNLDQAKKIAIEIGAKYIGRDHQIDTYFYTPNGRLKMRESSLMPSFFDAICCGKILLRLTV